jgi:hypothetical protein
MILDDEGDVIDLLVTNGDEVDTDVQLPIADSIAVDSDAFDASGEEETENKQVDSVEQDASSGGCRQNELLFALALGMPLVHM